MARLGKLRLSSRPRSGESALDESPLKARPGRGPRLRTLFLALLALGIAARLVRYLLNFPLWGDEAFVAVNLLGRSYRELVQPLVYNQIVPLMFMWAELALAETLGYSEYALRLLPTVAGIAGLLLFWRFLREHFDVRSSVLALGFLAAAYYPIRHGAEVKPYSTDLFIALLLLWLAGDLLKHPRSLLRWALLLLAGPAALWWSYPAAFVVGGAGLTLLALGIRQRSRGTVLAAILFGVASAGSFWLCFTLYAKAHSVAAASQGLNAIQMWDAAFPPLARPWLLPWWLIESHIGNLLAYPVGAKNGGSILTAVLVVVGSIRLARARPLLLMLLLSPLPLNLLAALLQKYPYGSTVRISMYMAPAFCTLAGCGLLTLLRHFLKPAGRRRGVQVAAGVLALIPLLLIVMDCINPYKKGSNYEAREVVRELAAHVAVNDEVVVLNSLREVEHAPWIRPMKGDGAQFVYYLSLWVEPKLRGDNPRFTQALRPLAPDLGRIHWAPAPQRELTRAAGATTWLLFFAGEEYRKFFEQAQIDAYISAYAGRLGPPEHIHKALSQKRLRDGRTVDWQAIEIWRFPPR